MTNELFESLLYEEEGTTVDFKRDQYPFANATDEQKSELVKDLLGFANAWRRTKGYILVGVDDVRGGRSTVYGISGAEQLHDHSLQQFINSLVNTPIRFQYRAFSYEGKQIGIFVIDEDQQRPIYLTRNYGKLARNDVYVRRGSSTDPTKPATPTEIAQMGAGKSRDKAELLVEFAELDRDDAIGNELHITCELCSVPEKKIIPKIPEERNDFLNTANSLRRHNANYLRDLADYEFLTRISREVRLTVKNIGEAPAKNVRVELLIPHDSAIRPAINLPAQPQLVSFISPDLSHVRSIHRYPGDVNIHQDKERSRIEIECQDLQPGRRIWSETFYVAASETGDYDITGEIFADNLPTPQPFTLTISATVTQTTMTLDELRRVSASLRG